jgi:hypothetical protein
VTSMESETGSGGDTEGESKGEYRRRRRRRSKRKGDDGGLSAETRHLLMLARWATGGLVMLATWAYGVYVIPKLGWGAAMFFPAGAAAMVCIASALSVPFISVLLMIVGFLLQIDAGPQAGLRRAAMAFVAVGALNAVWKTMMFFLSKREVTRNEAGYK